MLVIVSIFRNNKKLYMLSKDTTGSLTLKPCIEGISVGSFIFSSNLPKNF